MEKIKYIVLDILLVIADLFMLGKYIKTQNIDYIIVANELLIISYLIDFKKNKGEE